MTLASLVGASLYAVPQLVRPSVAAAATVAPVPLTAPDEASARASARLSGQRVQVASELTGSSTTSVNPDGTVTVDSFAGPIRVAQADGSWADVDTTLVANKDGSISPKMHPEALVFAGAGGTALTQRPVASIGSGVNAMQWLWTGSLPAPTLVGDTATYANVQPGVDLVLQATRSGFEQSFVVRSRPLVPLSFSLPIKVGSGLTVAGSDNGNVVIKTKAGQVLGSAAQPIMWDAQTDPSSGEHTHQQHMTPALGAVSSGTLPVALAPDAAFLADPKTVYPVTIDPSVTLNPYFDTFVEGGYTSDQSGSTDLKLGYNGAGDVARSFITFNTSGLRGKVVSAATLSLWNYHSWSCTAKPWQVWDTGLPSTSSRWTAQPAWGSVWSTSTATASDSGCSPGWVTQNVQTLVQAWANNTNTYNALGLRASDETDPFQWKRFNSGDASSNIPKLSVTYNTAPGVPTATTMAPGGSFGTTLYAGSLKPTFTAKSTDADGNTVKLTFQVGSGTLPTPPIVATGVTALVASGTPVSFTPTTALTEGSVYEWRAKANDGTADSVGWSPWQVFTVDSTIPAAPTVGSTTYLNNGSWNGASGTAGTFTFTPASADTAYVYSSLDGATAVKVIGNGSTAVTARHHPDHRWDA